MSDIDELVRLIAFEVAQRPFNSPGIPLKVHFDEPDEVEESSTAGDAEGQSFIIEYVDATGVQSRRRITVWAIREGANGIPCLFARCHERQAERSFRIDRIRCCIDYDGEVFDDVPAFLHENFGMALEVARRRMPENNWRWTKIQERIKHDAVLLAALSRVDGVVMVSETDAATNHLAWQAEQDGLMLEDAEILSIHRYINRLRPTEPAIHRAVSHTSIKEPRHIQRLLLAAAAVIDADGTRHPREIAMLNAMSRELIGANIA